VPIRREVVVFSELLVFRRKAIEEATAELMSENGIPRRGSADIIAVWNAKKSVQVSAAEH